MLRRRIYAYAVLVCTGIIAGYLALERCQMIYAGILMIYVGACICYVRIDGYSGNMVREKRVLWFLVLLGFVLFAAKFITMNMDIRDSSGDVVDIDNVTSIEGTVTKVQKKEEGYTIYVRTDNPIDQNICCSYSVDMDSSALRKFKNTMVMGNRVLIYGTMKEPSGQVNPHCFDYALYLESINVRYTFSAKSFALIGENDDVIWKYRRFIYDRRENFINQFHEKKTRSFIKGIIFGDKSEISAETIQEFNENSTGHVLAVSGLHIGFIFMLLRRLLKRRRTKGAAILIIALIFIYGESTLWSASTVRAVLVMSISIMAMYLRRQFDLLCSISTAALIILIHNPYQLFNTGFQMSFLAMLGIAFLAEPLASWVGQDFATLLAVQFAVAPYSAFVFHRFNILSIFINIPIVAIASLLVPMCIVSLMIMTIWGTTIPLLTTLIEDIANCLISVNKLFNFGGIFSNQVCSVKPGFLITLYLMVVILASEWTRIRLLRDEKRKIAIVLALSIIPGVCIGMATGQLDGACVTFVSVGQGDSTHVHSGKADVLIDGGGNNEYNIGENVLEPYLLGNGISDIDMALVTHLHMDHYKGITELEEVYPVKSLYVPSMYEGSDESPEGAKFLDVGDNVTISSNIYIEPLWPIGVTEAPSATDNNNELNMVYMIHYNGVKIMITGDLIEEDETKMIDYYSGTDKLRCDVLKVGHHGSKTSSSEAFIDAVSPTYAVISVGKNNLYGHPAPEIVERYEDRGIKVYRTDLNGAVGIWARNGKVTKVRSMM